MFKIKIPRASQGVCEGEQRKEGSEKEKEGQRNVIWDGGKGRGKQHSLRKTYQQTERESARGE